MRRKHTNPDGTVVTVTLGNRVVLGEGVIFKEGNHWCAGRDRRGYEMPGYLDGDGNVVIVAGCRTFSVEEAREHWGSPEYPDPAIGADMLRKIDYLAACAAAQTKGE